MSSPLHQDSSQTSRTSLEKTVEKGEALQYPANIDPPIDTEKQPATQPDYPDGGSRAWAVALGTSGILFCTMGYMNTFGVYQEFYESHQLNTHTSSQIAWIGSLQAFFLFCGALVGGPVFDRLGAVVIWPSAIVYLFSVFMTSLCKELWQFMLAQGLLGGVALGMTWAPAMAATAQYFHKKRGAAMGIAIAGSSLGGIIFPIALGRMLTETNLGFGWSVRILAFLMTGVLIISCIPIKARLPPRNGQFFIPRAFTEPKFVLVVVASFLGLMGMFIPMFYLPVYAVSQGMGSTLASYTVAILNAASFFGRVIPGVLSDKLGHFNIYAIAMLCTGILSLCWTQCTTNATIIVFASLFGFFSGAIISGLSVCLTSCTKDPRNIGTYMGMGMSIASVSVLIGPPVTGELVKQSGNFDNSGIYSGVFVLAASVAAFAAKIVGGHGLFTRA